MTYTDEQVLRDNARLNQAIIFAAERHANQLRKGTALPYILHPLETLQILSNMQADRNVQIAGVLHDVLEDTDTTAEEIASLFGEDVAALVSHHSEDKSKSWAERKTTAILAAKNADDRVKMLITLPWGMTYGHGLTRQKRNRRGITTACWMPCRTCRITPKQPQPTGN